MSNMFNYCKVKIDIFVPYVIYLIFLKKGKTLMLNKKVFLLKSGQVKLSYCLCNFLKLKVAISMEKRF